jgi:hypothetical protein
MSINPMAGMELQAKLAAMGAKERVKVDAGQTVGTYVNGKFVPDYSAPDKPPAGFMRDAKGNLVGDRGYIDAQKEIRAAGKPQVNVNTNMPPLEKREQGDMGALHVKNYGELQAAAGTARKENALLTGLERISIDTGKFTPANATVAAWVVGMGANKESLKNLAASGQSFTGFAKDLVLQKQLAQKGPQTESDAQRLEQTVAQLGNTGDANSLLIAFSKAQNNRTIEQEKFYNDWWTKNKTMQGADAAWINGKGGTSIWDEAALKKFQKGNVIDFNQLPKSGG